jgi:predicted nucleotidyltransferase
MTDSLSSAAIDPQVLDEIVERIVRLAQPDKIVLFGSAAPGKGGSKQ